MHRALPTLLLSLFFLLFIPLVSFSQTVEDRAASASEQLERRNAEADRQKRLDDLQALSRSFSARARPVEAPEPVNSNAECIAIDFVDVTGTSLIPSAVIAREVDFFESRCLTLDDLNLILERITLLYVDRGYFTSRALLPEQDLSDGRLEVAVVEGRLEDIVINGEPGHHPGEIRTAFPNLKGRHLNLRDIEQGLDQINRLRASKATMSVRAGEKSGYSVIDTSIQRSKSWYGSLSFDNLGAATSGRYQTRLDLALENSLRANEIIRLSYLRSADEVPGFHSDDRPNSDTFDVGLSAVYGYWTLDVSGSYSKYRSFVDHPLRPIPTAGLTATFDTSLSYGLHRNQTSNTLVTVGLKRKNNQNFILGSLVDVSSRILTIGKVSISHSRQFLGGQLALGLDYFQGLPLFNALDDAESQGLSQKAQFKKLGFSASYLKDFSLGSLSLLYKASMSGQWSKDNLFGSEQMSLGGYSTVRGLRESVVFGNRGLLNRHELSITFPELAPSNLSKLLGRIETFVAIDVGRIFKQARYDIPSAQLGGGTVGLRTKGGHVTLEVAYSKILPDLTRRVADYDKHGEIYARGSISF